MLRRTIATAYAASLTILSLCWAVGAYGAPRSHESFARLTIKGPSGELKLSGAAFDCVWDHDLGGRRCETELGGTPLRIAFNSSGCSATYRSETKVCQRGGEVMGAYRIEGAAWRAEPPASLWLLHELGTMGECAWGDVAMYTTLLLTLFLTHGLSYCGAGLRRRLWLRALVALPFLPVSFLILFLVLVRMGYAD